MDKRNQEKLIRSFQGVNVFSKKTGHCYTVTSKDVGTRSRVTMKDIYGNTCRGSIKDKIMITEFESAILSEGERVHRRKCKVTDSNRMVLNCYRAFKRVHGSK